MDVSSPRSPAFDDNEQSYAGPIRAERFQASIPTAILRKRRPRKESNLPKRRQCADLDRKVNIINEITCAIAN